MEESFIAVRNEIGYTNKRFDDALEIRERLAVFEARFAARSRSLSNPAACEASTDSSCDLPAVPVLPSRINAYHTRTGAI